MQPNGNVPGMGRPVAGTSMNNANDAPMPAGPTFDNGPSVVKEKDNKKTGWILAVVLLLIIAAGGVGFGVWAYMDGDAQKAALNEQIANLNSQLETVTEDETAIDNNVKKMPSELAQNLINPYIVSFTYLNDVFDHDFNENTKFYLSFKNMSFNSFSNFGKSAIGADTASIRYDDINKEYKYLFGEDKDLEKANYQEGYNTFTYETDSWGGGEFVVERLGGGGTMAGLLSVIKDAYYNEDGIVVEVYHDKINVCVVEGADENYCVKEMGYHTVIDEEIRQLIDKNSEQIPVYNMEFKNAGDHYYLSTISKQ